MSLLPPMPTQTRQQAASAVTALRQAAATDAAIQQQLLDQSAATAKKPVPMPLIIGGIAALGIIGFMMLRKK